MGDKQPEVVDLAGTATTPKATATTPKVTATTPKATVKAKEPSSSGKKLKQLRLPFTPVNSSSKAAGNSSTTPGSATAKRKRSDSAQSGEAPNKVVVEDKTASPPSKENGATEAAMATMGSDEKRRTPRRVRPTFLGKAGQDNGETNGDSSSGPSPAAKKKINLYSDNISGERNPSQKATSDEANVSDAKAAQNDGESSSKSGTPPKAFRAVAKVDADTPGATASPAVLEARTTSLKVAAAKLAVAVNELNHEMEKAADQKDFLRAASIKEEADAKSTEREKLLAALASGDVAEMNVALASVVSAPQTPNTPVTSRKRVSTSSATTTTSTTPETSAKKIRKRTPKQEAAQRKKEEKAAVKAKEKEEKAKEKVKEKEAKKREKELKKEEERQKKKEKEVQKELEKKRKEEEKEAERKAKEEAKKEREAMKEAEKMAKEEEKRKKEEEKKKMEEEKRKLDEAEKQRAAKEAMTFKKFFFKKPEDSKETETATSSGHTSGNLNQFRVKKDMRLAPETRSSINLERKQALDAALASEDIAKTTLPSVDLLYLKSLKSGHKPLRSSKTWPAEEVGRCEDEDDVEVIEEGDEASGQVLTADEDEVAGTKQRVRCKLLQFCENERPAYFGTWSKQTTAVSGRRPFGKDLAFFDYDYDSDDDWEEEEQGESLSDEEKDKEEDEEDEEDEDDGFFVGHGVLDKDEMHFDDDSDREDDQEDGGGGGGGGSASVEYDEELEQKKQRLRAQEFEEGRKKKVSKLKPRVFGCFWTNDEHAKTTAGQLLKILAPYAAVCLVDKPIPLALSSQEGGEDNGAADGNVLDAAAGGSASKKRRNFPEEAVKDLIRLLHVNTHSKVKLAKEFAAFLRSGDDTSASAEETSATSETSTVKTPKSNGGVVPVNKIIEKIFEIAEYKSYEGEGPMQNKTCWVVKPEVLAVHGMTDSIPVPNAWQYSSGFKPRKKATPVADAKAPKSAEASPPLEAAAVASTNKPEKKTPSIQTLFSKMEAAKKENSSHGSGAIEEIVICSSNEASKDGSPPTPTPPVDPSSLVTLSTESVGGKDHGQGNASSSDETTKAATAKSSSSDGKPKPAVKEKKRVQIQTLTSKKSDKNKTNSSEEKKVESGQKPEKKRITLQTLFSKKQKTNSE